MTSDALQATQSALPVVPVMDALLANSADALWIVDRNQSLLRCNEAFTHLCRELLGAAPPQSVRPPALLRGRPKLLAYWEGILSRVLAGETVLVEGSLRGSSGKRYFRVAANPVRDGEEIVAAIISIRDLTKNRRRENHELFKAVLTRISSDEHDLVKMLERTIEAFCFWIGWDVGAFWLVREEAIEAVAIWTPLWMQADRYRDHTRGMRFSKGRGLPGRVWASGSALWYSDLAEETLSTRSVAAVDLGLHSALLLPVKDAEGKVLGVCEFLALAVRPAEVEMIEPLEEMGLEIGRHLERYRAEEDRRHLSELLQRKSDEWMKTFDTIESPIFVLDLTGRVLRLNRAACLTAQSTDFRPLLGRPIDELGSESHWRTLRELVESVRDARTSTSFQFHDGAARRFWDISVDLSDVPGQERVIVVMRDITRLVELQESVRRGEQLSAMGELVAGVSHEVRNPLFGISATLDALEMSLRQEDPEVTLLFAALRRWVSRLTDLMQQLLEYGKTWSSELRTGDLSEVLQQAIDVTAPVCEQAGVRIRCRTAPSRDILLDPARLVQAFQNLIVNAVQHSGPGDEIEIDLTADEPDQIELVIRDHGPGFRQEDLWRVFQPFFTRRRGGSGLGLSIVQRVIDEHGGTISAENHPDGGALLRLRLPTMQAQNATRVEAKAG